MSQNVSKCLKMSFNVPKCKKIRCVTDRPTDRLTDRLTDDQPTNRVTYRVACTRLEIDNFIWLIAKCIFEHSDSSYVLYGACLIFLFWYFLVCWLIPPICFVIIWAQKWQNISLRLARMCNQIWPAWWRGNAMARWHDRTMSRWRDGAMTWWYDGAMAW